VRFISEPPWFHGPRLVRLLFAQNINLTNGEAGSSGKKGAGHTGFWHARHRLSRRPVSRILLPYASRRAVRSFLWDARRRAPQATYPRIVPPGKGRAGRSGPGAVRLLGSCWRWGLPCRPSHPGRGALLPHLFTLTTALRAAAVCFLWHFPSDCSALMLSSTDAPRHARRAGPVRTFLTRTIRQASPGATATAARTIDIVPTHRHDCARG